MTINEIITDEEVQKLKKHTDGDIWRAMCCMGIANLAESKKQSNSVNVHLSIIYIVLTIFGTILYIRG